MPIVRTLKYKIIGVVVVLGLLGYVGYKVYSNSVGVLISNAKSCFAIGDLNCAQENLNRVLDKNPNHLDALFMKSKIDVQTGNHQDLEATLQKVLGIQPDLNEARKMLIAYLLSKCPIRGDRERTPAPSGRGGLFSEGAGAVFSGQSRNHGGRHRFHVAHRRGFQRHRGDPFPGPQSARCSLSQRDPTDPTGRWSQGLVRGPDRRAESGAHVHDPVGDRPSVVYWRGFGQRASRFRNG